MASEIKRHPQSSPPLLSRDYLLRSNKRLPQAPSSPLRRYLASGRVRLVFRKTNRASLPLWKSNSKAKMIKAKTTKTKASKTKPLQTNKTVATSSNLHSVLR